MADLILTGASRGIGHALALALATRGDRLVLVARLEALVTALEQRGGAVPSWCRGDLSSLAGARRLGGARGVCRASGAPARARALVSPSLL